MDAVGPALPELHHLEGDAEPAPLLRTLDVAAVEGPFGVGDPGLECLAVLDRLGLPRRDGTALGATGQ